MSEARFEFTKENIDIYLKELAKSYRKLVGKGMPAEMILIGGASILINYGFRNMTTDIDALIRAASGMKDAINFVRDKYELSDGWLNDDFKKTDLYSDKLPQFSVYYKTYSNIVSIRTIAAEYLIAMKLRSGRLYKHDLSDVLGILAEHERKGVPITLERVKKAVNDLYGDWGSLPEKSGTFIEDVMAQGRFGELYEEIEGEEKAARTMLIRFEQNYPGVIKTDNVDEIIGNIKKADRADILDKLKANRDHQQ
ncbi:MAG: hypothetical protein IJL78_05590 [Lachnospiraceae bacterium]|nr:hypothetical protein [Lachnospiraceae bacterium]